MTEIHTCPKGHLCATCQRDARRRLLVEQLPHGTLARYQRVGCRCQPCTDASRDYMRERRAAIMADPKLQKHGTLSTYYAGCRCEKCRDKNSRYHRARLAKKKKEEKNEGS